MSIWLPTLISLLIAAGGVFTPQIQAFLVAHPQVAIVAGAVWAILSHWFPSPVVPPAPPAPPPIGPRY